MRALTAVTLTCGLALGAARPAGQQPPAFRASAEVVLVDVQVVNGVGEPIPALTKEQFRVTVDRRPRAVLSADFLSYAGAPASADARRPVEAPAAGAAAVPVAAAPPTGRTFVVAVDLLSFDVGASRGIATAARQFITQLHPLDRIGLYPYPLGPRVPPTTDHAATLAALDQLVGQKLQPAGRYAISGADIVDWWAGESTRIIARECGGGPAAAMTFRGGGAASPAAGASSSCAADLGLEIAARTQEAEAQAGITNAQVRQLFQLLGAETGRKFVVLMSGGIAMSDRPGGRPDGGTAAVELGTLAARNNIGLYSLFLDSSYLGRFSANVRTASRAPVNAERDSAVASQWLSQIADGSGGALMKVLVGNGEASLTRVLRETSAYYLLGVAAAPTDTDGRPHAIDVTVTQRGLTVRSRRWVVVPPPN